MWATSVFTSGSRCGICDRADALPLAHGVPRATCQSLSMHRAVLVLVQLRFPRGIKHAHASCCTWPGIALDDMGLRLAK